MKFEWFKLTDVNAWYRIMEFTWSIWVTEYYITKENGNDMVDHGVGGLKLWEGSLDLVKSLKSELQDERLSLNGKRVLEVGSSRWGDYNLLC